MPLVTVVLLLLAIERGAELVINRRNARRLRGLGAQWLDRDGFGLILVAQVLLFTMLPTEVLLAPWVATGGWTWALLALALGAQALRYWCIATLGARWSIRVVTVPGAPRIVRGPYRLFPHPNYVAVLTEAIVVPLAFGAWATLAVVAPVQLVALWRRVRLEEDALSQPGRSPAPGGGP